MADPTKTKKPKGGKGGKSILQRLIELIPNPDIVVTESTTWKAIGFNTLALQTFLDTRVRLHFGLAFDTDDAGKTVGDLARAITKASGGGN